jgi:transcriptional regulator with XRE-family HTH domain
VPKKPVPANSPSPSRLRFAKALRAARLNLATPLSQEELADVAGVHRTYVGQVERGEVNISIDNMHRLAAAVKVPLWELLKA